MDQLNAIAGLPRAGTTLLCNVLNQNPEIEATSTSVLSSMVRSFSQCASNSIEVKGLLNLRPEETTTRLVNTARAMCHAWHMHYGKSVVFDKGRGWTSVPELFRDISPNGVMVVVVRDLRDVFASVERENRKNGILVSAPLHIADRYASHFAPEGVIGGPLRAVTGLIDAKPANVIFVRYEDIVKDLELIMAQLYSRLPIPYFKHDPKRVPDTAEDPDGFYLGKFPHRASGKIEARQNPWQNVVPQRIADDIMATATVFNGYFGYTR